MTSEIEKHLLYAAVGLLRDGEESLGSDTVDVLFEYRDSGEESTSRFEPNSAEGLPRRGTDAREAIRGILLAQQNTDEWGVRCADVRQYVNVSDSTVYQVATTYPWLEKRSVNQQLNHYRVRPKYIDAVTNRLEIDNGKKNL